VSASLAIAPASPLPVWDLFCRIVDNFGDIGVCWRLGRQLAAEHGLAVRLWLDNPGALAKLRGANRPLPWEPGGLRVMAWDEAGSVAAPGEVVIEAFACEPPAEFVQKMTHQNKAPLWINLEYLSAEDWIEDCHGLPSPHPRLPLSKFFYFPGFTATSGGLVREAGLLAERDAFRGDPTAVQAWWQGLGGRDAWVGRRNLSLFSYELPGLAALLARLAGGKEATRLLVPEGRVLPGLLQWFGQSQAGPGAVLERGALACQLLPFLTQPDYDRLLWACELNVVRGEDSFVRAQWAGRPFIWHVYRQEEDSHLAKLEAFLGRYLAGAESYLASAVAALHQAWNRDQALDGAWERAVAHLPGWTRHGQAWAAGLAGQTDLASRLVRFAKSHL
jgi:uncharacterized repeat protein (TIGR03837 family)